MCESPSADPWAITHNECLSRTDPAPTSRPIEGADGSSDLIRAYCLWSALKPMQWKRQGDSLFFFFWAIIEVWKSSCCCYYTDMTDLRLAIMTLPVHLLYTGFITYFYSGVSVCECECPCVWKPEVLSVGACHPACLRRQHHQQSCVSPIRYARPNAPQVSLHLRAHGTRFRCLPGSWDLNQALGLAQGRLLWLSCSHFWQRGVSMCLSPAYRCESQGLGILLRITESMNS